MKIHDLPELVPNQAYLGAALQDIVVAQQMFIWQQRRRIELLESALRIAEWRAQAALARADEAERANQQLIELLVTQEGEE